MFQFCIVVVVIAIKKFIHEISVLNYGNSHIVSNLIENSKKNLLPFLC